MSLLFSIRRSSVSLSLIAAFALGGCQPQKVILVPGENDLVILNGCVISACNYLAAMETQHKLEPNFWVKILLVRYRDHPAGHAYCVWETDGTIYGFFFFNDTSTTEIYTREPKAIAAALADELSKVLNEHLTVAQAEFVEPHKSDAYRF